LIHVEQEKADVLELLHLEVEGERLVVRHDEVALVGS